MSEIKETNLQDFLKRVRLEKGLTQNQAATKLGLTQSYYCSLENGYTRKGRTSQYSPSLELMIKISRYSKYPLVKIIKLVKGI